MMLIRRSMATTSYCICCCSCIRICICIGVHLQHRHRQRLSASTSASATVRWSIRSPVSRNTPSEWELISIKQSSPHDFPQNLISCDFYEKLQSLKMRKGEIEFSMGPIQQQLIRQCVKGFSLLPCLAIATKNLWPCSKRSNNKNNNNKQPQTLAIIRSEVAASASASAWVAASLVHARVGGTDTASGPPKLHLA